LEGKASKSLKIEFKIRNLEGKKLTHPKEISFETINCRFIQKDHIEGEICANLT